MAFVLLIVFKMKNEILVYYLSKINTWGYSTINFFAPMSRYASAGGGPVNASWEFKEMVKALHGAGIEVIHVFSTFIARRHFFPCFLLLFSSLNMWNMHF